MKTKTNNERKQTMLCPYCNPPQWFKNAAGLSMHVMRGHPARWKGGLEVSLPQGYVPGQARPAFARKGQKKTPIPMDCPACDYHIEHPPAMARHIQAAHPEIWKGSLNATLGTAFPKARPIKKRLRLARPGRGPIDPTLLAPEKAEELRRRRVYEHKRRQKFKDLGLSATGKPYKRLSLPKQPDPEPVVLETRIIRAAVPIREFINRCPECGTHLDAHYLAAAASAKLRYETARKLINRYETNQNESE